MSLQRTWKKPLDSYGLLLQCFCLQCTFWWLLVEGHLSDFIKISQFLFWRWTKVEHHEGECLTEFRIFIFGWTIKLKLQSVTFFGLKMIRNQKWSKYITSQCSKLSPYFSPIHNGYLIIMFSNLSGTGRNSQEIQARCCIITSHL